MFWPASNWFVNQRHPRLCCTALVLRVLAFSDFETRRSSFFSKERKKRFHTHQTENSHCTRTILFKSRTMTELLSTPIYGSKTATAPSPSSSSSPRRSTRLKHFLERIHSVVTRENLLSLLVILLLTLLAVEKVERASPTRSYKHVEPLEQQPSSLAFGDNKSFVVILPSRNGESPLKVLNISEGTNADVASILQNLESSQMPRTLGQRFQSMLSHPLVLLDLTLFVFGHSSLRMPIRFLQHHFTRWIPRRPITRWVGQSRRCIMPVTRSLRKSMQSMGRLVRKLYSNRSKLSTLSDYTWYVGHLSSNNNDLTQEERSSSGE